MAQSVKVTSRVKVLVGVLVMFLAGKGKQKQNKIKSKRSTANDEIVNVSHLS